MSDIRTVLTEYTLHRMYIVDRQCVSDISAPVSLSDNTVLVDHHIQLPKVFTADKIRLKIGAVNASDEVLSLTIKPNVGA